MHETAMANSIVQTILQHAHQAGAGKVRSVTVELGEWTTFNPEQLGFWVKIGFENTIARGARVRFKRIRGKIRCNSCGIVAECPAPSNGIDHFIGPILQCMHCQSPDVEIVQGREAMIRKIVIDK